MLVCRLMAPSKENQAKFRKACIAMKPYGISAATVKSGLKHLLKVYDNNWMYIEEDDYKVLLDFIIEPDGPKRMESVNHEFKLRDESEDEEETKPLKRKPLLRGEDTSSCMYAFEIRDGNGMAFAGYLCENGENLLGLEYNNIESKASKNEGENESEDVPPSPCSSEIDLASSSNGEVKLTFSICKPPPGFRIPSLDAVMKCVEDTYREKIQGLGTEFSLSQLLKDICQCFMEQGNASDHVGNKIPSFDNFKEPEKQGGRLRKQHMVGIDELSGSSSLTIFTNEQSTVDLCSKCYCVDDITRGLEKQEISLINEVDNEKLPTFTYIHTNVNYRTAHVKFMLPRIADENSCPDCFGDCLSSEVPCACAVETGGEFAYTSEGLVDEKFLKNCIDITLKPSKKDYFYCDDCPLERMKKKRTNQLQSGSCKGHLVFMTPEGKGWGLRNLEDLPRGTFVCEHVGEIVTNSELFERNEQNKNEQHTYPVLLDADWSSEGFLKDEEALCLDATSFGNVARFINHRCVDANMVEIPVEVESPDHHYYHHAFFTTREVKAMEELTWDYGIDFDDDSHPVKAFACKCGSKCCKAVKSKKREVGEKQVIARLVVSKE
ncbi:hypothetical protein L1987_57204 [Smallanthus sonchifolius]|uniref:Uncharacterized protein n=1 Tax=Smallanthus sonchifolius TaxID=185202 RepID=A0ACB9DBW6_9ASTR|nr:hypothetical protein L1987_57204 [Smallanthus sonchifolius]